MKHLIYICLLLPLLAACHDNIDLTQYEEKAKPVIYAFPTPSDSLVVYVGRSIPVRKGNTITATPKPTVSKLECTVNGTPIQLESSDAENSTYRRFITKVDLKPGDKILVKAKVDDLDEATAETVVPTAVPVSYEGQKEVERRDEDDNTRDYLQLLARFKDDAATKDYYAVRVMMDKRFDYITLYDNKQHLTKYFYDLSKSLDEIRKILDLSDDVYVDTIHNVGYGPNYLDIANMDEPVLKRVGEVDDAFGYSDVIYQYFYIFDDSKINGLDYTLHLNLKSWDVTEGKITVEFYHITPALYRFLRSMNDAEGNELGNLGLTSITPNYTNIVNGLGVLGAMNKQQVVIINTRYK